MPKVYIASSWKNQILCKSIAKILRDEKIEVDCFCDDSTGRYAFHWTEVVKEKELGDYNAIDFLEDEKVWKAFNEDKRGLDWADTCLLILPAGKSSHLEAGYAVGQGKRLFIYGEFPKGEFDVMYGFATGLYQSKYLFQMTKDIKNEYLITPFTQHSM